MLLSPKFKINRNGVCVCMCGEVMTLSQPTVRLINEKVPKLIMVPLSNCNVFTRAAAPKSCHVRDDDVNE